MNEEQFKQRTKQVGLRVMRLTDRLPKGRTADVLGRQLLRSATSIGANYRAACRGKSRADVLHKLAIVEEETDESMYWIEVIADSKLIPKQSVRALLSELNEILSMTVASMKTLRVRPDVKGQFKIQNPKSKMRS